MTAGKSTAQVLGLFGLLATAISLGFTAADFYWTVGTEDCGYSDSKAVWELYSKNNINVASEAQPGNHEWLV